MFAEFQTYFLKRKLVFETRQLDSVWPLGIPWNAEYPRKVLPEGTSTSWNLLEFTYHIIGDAMWLPSVLSGSSLFTE